MMNGVDTQWAEFIQRFRIPLIAAPMTAVSGIDVVAAAAGAGVGASFPVHNASSSDEVDRWLGMLGEQGGPVIPNVVVHRTNTRLSEDLAVLTRRCVPAVITSVGSPQQVIGPLHDAGVLVLSDVASLRHAERAVAAGADALVLLTAGAGGQTGWANPLAFIRAVRRMWDGPMVLAGGICDGASLLTAVVAGCDLGYMGTAFIATHESAAPRQWKNAVVAASIDDIELTSGLTGLPTSVVRTRVPKTVSRDDITPTGQVVDGFEMARLSTGTRPDRGPAQSETFSAGHSAIGVDRVVSVADLVARVEYEYRDAIKHLAIKSGALASEIARGAENPSSSRS
ncbi:MAG TPA: nitronate monooxygenase [Trebonia sp.]|nr:nitronate monooxygenase [Trebonia sp.]